MLPPTFADALDDALQRQPRVATFVASPASRLVSDVRTPMLPGDPLTAATPRWLVDDVLKAPQPDHLMSAVQQLAFRRFATLGAALRANFSATELRREYRLLAQRYHPDRNTAADAVERHAFASRFGEATACYRTLRALVLH